MEGTQTTLDELLSVEETGDNGARDETRQVRNYAVALDRFIPRAAKEGYGVFTMDLIRDLHRAVMKDDPDYRTFPATFKRGSCGSAGVKTSHIEVGILRLLPMFLTASRKRSTTSGMRGCSR
ncbi:Fic/DOC family N-terminal domain-containing protein [Bradyrhizobium arachidis]|uniref:Fic/DOC family N-terminal domain-containing protein n=1 Tax=Bradyrhizobium arachidis TaxID=858423 RepID=UPI001FCD6EC0|nr:Fic/DOC family N-terminal domain-containing protein [Bradyrhizobium arachidis]